MFERIKALVFPKRPPPRPPEPLDPLVMFLGGPAHGRMARTQKLRVTLNEPELNAQYIYDRSDVPLPDDASVGRVLVGCHYALQLVMVVPIDRKSYLKVSIPVPENSLTP